MIHGFVVVTPHVSTPNRDAYGKAIPFRPGPLGPMKTTRARGGTVRIGFGDGTTVLGFRTVPIAPVFDPLADSMVPVR